MIRGLGPCNKALKSPRRCAGVGTIVVRVPLLWMMRRHSCDQKKKSLSFLMGPPTSYPKSLYRFFGRDVAKKLRAFNTSFRKYSKALPWNRLVPEREIRLICPPADLPVAAS